MQHVAVTVLVLAVNDSKSMKIFLLLHLFLYFSHCCRSLNIYFLSSLHSNMLLIFKGWAKWKCGKCFTIFTAYMLNVENIEWLEVPSCIYRKFKMNLDNYHSSEFLFNKGDWVPKTNVKRSTGRSRIPFVLNPSDYSLCVTLKKKKKVCDSDFWNLISNSLAKWSFKELRELRILYGKSIIHCTNPLW